MTTRSEKAILAAARRWWKSIKVHDSDTRTVNTDYALELEEACAADAAARRKRK